MAKKKNNKTATSPSNAIPVQAGATDAETWRNAASVICGPDLAAYRVISAVGGLGAFAQEWDVPTLMAHLRDQAGAVQGGDLSQAEAMLMNQATALQNLFARLVERGMGQNTLPVLESFMKLALRAQNQCRATLETLSAIKNPPVIFAKQANIANGPQQVNNGNEAPRVRENKIEQTQLLEDIPNERLDFGATEKAIGNDKEMASMGAINWATNRGRKTGERKTRV